MWRRPPRPAVSVIVGEGKGAARFEVGAPSFVTYAAAEASLKLIEQLGVGNIQAHAMKRIARLRKDMAAIGYPTVTPEGNGSSIISFRVKDPEAVTKKLERANVVATMISRYKLLRVSMSVFTTDDDLDQLLNALS